MEISVAATPRSSFGVNGGGLPYWFEKRRLIVSHGLIRLNNLRNEDLINIDDVPFVPKSPTTPAIPPFDMNALTLSTGRSNSK